MIEPLSIALKVLPHGEGLPLPRRQTPDAAGADLMAALPQEAPLTLPPGRHALVPCGIAIALPSGYEAQIRPRSGLAAKHGVTVLNAPGTIDADYRGEIRVILINHGTEDVVIARGERIAQLVVAPVTPTSFVLAAQLDETERGAGGFGSTGR